MGKKIVSFIMTIVIILIIAIIIIFGMVIWQNINNVEDNGQVLNFVSTLTEEDYQTDTIDKDVQTPDIIESTIQKFQGLGTTEENKNDYSEVIVDKYFYNQLNEESKIIYRSFEANKENMKSGTYQIELGDVFSEVLDSQNGENLLGDYYQSAVEAYNYDNPSIFYLSPSKMFLNIEKVTKVFTGNEYNTYINNGNRQNYFVDEFKNREEVISAISKVEQVKNYLVSNKRGDTYENIKMVHDYLIDNIEYDKTIQTPNIYDIYGALINHVSVCEGYARAFKYIMDEMGIPSVLVIGKATNSEDETENHAWNYVKLNGAWYAVDTTWDDPIVINGGRASNASRTKYFLKGSETMNKDHIPSGQFTEGGKVFNYPPLSNKDY